MNVGIRDYEPSDEERVVGLSLRAWAPVFGAVEEMLGRELFVRLRGDWLASQARAVRDVLADPAYRVWVADVEDQPVGFAAARVHGDSGVGEIYMIAVDPRAQGQGVGSALTEVATDWLRQAGMQVAMIETGGDPGHPRRGASTRRPITRRCRPSASSRPCRRSRTVEERRPALARRRTSRRADDGRALRGTRASARPRCFQRSRLVRMSAPSNGVRANEDQVGAAMPPLCERPVRQAATATTRYSSPGASDELDGAGYELPLALTEADLAVEHEHPLVLAMVDVQRGPKPS
jgi:GNAT superfamily N-acetyltransferase